MLSKVASSTIFLVFGMTRSGIEPWSPGSLVNTLLIRPIVICFHKNIWFQVMEIILRKKKSLPLITILYTNTLYIKYSVFLFNSNQFKQICVTPRCDSNSPLRVKKDLKVMIVKDASTFPRFLEQEPHHQMQFSVVPRTPLVGENLISQQGLQLVYSKPCH